MGCHRLLWPAETRQAQTGGGTTGTGTGLVDVSGAGAPVREHRPVRDEVVRRAIADGHLHHIAAYHIEPGAPALMATSVALMATSTLVTLLAPFFPRLLWITAALALPLAALSAWIGADHG